MRTGDLLGSRVQSTESAPEALDDYPPDERRGTPIEDTVAAPDTATINWLESRTGKSIDGSTLPGGTGVLLNSRYHTRPPGQYLVYRMVPKPFWHFWVRDRVEETRLDAQPEGARISALGGRFTPAPLWRLPEPENESGRATFRARTDTKDALSGALRSGSIWLEDVSRTRQFDADVEARIQAPWLEIGPKISAHANVSKTWRVRVADDPWIEVGVLQGESVLTHLRSLEAEFARFTPENPGSMNELPAGTADYFVEQPLDGASLSWRLEPDHPLAVTVRVPEREDLRAAFCIQIRNVEDGSLTTSDPVFLTYVDNHVVATDVTLDMLRPEPRELLFMLAEAGFDVGGVAERRNWDQPTAWRRLVAAAGELGADSVSEAASFVVSSASH